jgi:hypothetical protein
MKNDISSSKMSMNIESETHIPKVNINNESPNKMLILNQNAFSCKKYYFFNFIFF